MNTKTKYSVWWVFLIVLTVIVSAITSKEISASGLFFSVAGHLAFSVLMSLIPLLVYWLIKKPLTFEEFMATVTAVWLFLAIANLAVM